MIGGEWGSGPMSKANVVAHSLPVERLVAETKPFWSLVKAVMVFLSV